MHNMTAKACGILVEKMGTCIAKVTRLSTARIFGTVHCAQNYRFSLMISQTYQPLSHMLFSFFPSVKGALSTFSTGPTNTSINLIVKCNTASTSGGIS